MQVQELATSPVALSVLASPRWKAFFTCLYTDLRDAVVDSLAPAGGERWDCSCFGDIDSWVKCKITSKIDEEVCLVEVDEHYVSDPRGGMFYSQLSFDAIWPPHNIYHTVLSALITGLTTNLTGEVQLWTTLPMLGPAPVPLPPRALAEIREPQSGGSADEAIRYWYEMNINGFGLTWDEVGRKIGRSGKALKGQPKDAFDDQYPEFKQQLEAKRASRRRRMAKGKARTKG